MESFFIYCRKCDKEIREGKSYVSINWHEEKFSGRTISVDYAEELVAVCKECAKPYSPKVVYELLANGLGISKQSNSAI